MQTDWQTASVRISNSLEEVLEHWHNSLSVHKKEWGWYWRFFINRLFTYWSPSRQKFRHVSGLTAAKLSRRFESRRTDLSVGGARFGANPGGWAPPAVHFAEFPQVESRVFICKSPGFTVSEREGGKHTSAGVWCIRDYLRAAEFRVSGCPLRYVRGWGTWVWSRINTVWRALSSLNWVLFCHRQSCSTSRPAENTNV